MTNPRTFLASALSAVLFSGVVAHTAVSADTRPEHLFNAHILSKFCNSPHGAPYDDGVCAGYITGIADAMSREDDTGKSVCLPRNLSTSDFSKLVTRRLARRPEDATRPAADVIRETLLAAFACDKP